MRTRKQKMTLDEAIETVERIISKHSIYYGTGTATPISDRDIMIEAVDIIDGEIPKWRTEWLRSLDAQELDCYAEAKEAVRVLRAVEREEAKNAPRKAGLAAIFDSVMSGKYTTGGDPEEL